MSCVEQGRWRYHRSDFGTAGRALFAKARARKMTQVTESMVTAQARHANQSQIWADVADEVAFCGVASETLAMSDAYESRAAQVEAYVRAFRPAPRQQGAVVAIDGRPVGLELFDSAAAFSRYLEKLTRSYALDAIETANGKRLAPSEAKVRRTSGSPGTGVAGGALALDGRVVHLAGFRVP